MPNRIRRHDGRLFLRIGPKNTNLVKYVEYLIPLKFRPIPSTGCRRDIENVLAYQKAEWLSLLMDRSENTTLVQGVEF